MRGGLGQSVDGDQNAIRRVCKVRTGLRRIHLAREVQERVIYGDNDEFMIAGRRGGGDDRRHVGSRTGVEFGKKSLVVCLPGHLREIQKCH